MKSFNPVFPVSNPHFQTIFPPFFTKVELPSLQDERFDLSDGDFVEIVWSKKPTRDDQKGIVILFHGLAGSARSAYIRRMIKRSSNLGFVSVVMNFRGCYNLPNNLPRSYHSGDTNDAREFIDYLTKSYPHMPLYAIGYSLGGNMLLKYLAQEGKSSKIKKAVAISAPMDLRASADRINSGLSKLYQWYLLRDLKRELLKKYKIFDMKKLLAEDEEEIKKIRTFWEFDAIYTSKIHGFKDAFDYYAKSSSKHSLQTIHTPTLIINAKDDPFMSTKVIPRDDEISDSITLEVYKHGGHVGFVNGSIFKPTFWLEDRIEEFLLSS